MCSWFAHHIQDCILLSSHPLLVPVVRKRSGGPVCLAACTTSPSPSFNGFRFNEMNLSFRDFEPGNTTKGPSRLDHQLLVADDALGLHSPSFKVRNFQDAVNLTSVDRAPAAAAASTFPPSSIDSRANTTPVVRVQNKRIGPKKVC